MKKFLSVLICLTIVLALTFAFVGCTPEADDTEGTMLLVVGGDNPVEYQVDLSKVELTQGLLSVLEYLKETEGLEFAHQEGFLTSVGALSQGGGHYIYVYTTVEKDFDVSQYAENIDYNGTTLTNAGVGAKEMTIEKDCTIYIGTIYWG